MCGICGQINLNFQTPIDFKMLSAMNNTIHHRGPDDEGIYVDNYVGLAMRRLSIIDVSQGKQPISNEDKDIWIVFNGEIYNYLELRTMLMKKGHVFKTKSDTESIVHLYEEKGINFINYLRGMFAIAIWDNRRKRLIIARDRLGIKPLFYSEYKGTLYFGSEIKTILSNKSYKREINYDSLAAFFTLSYIPAPLSIFKGIMKLPPGHLMIIDKGGIKIKKYWDVEFKPDREKKETVFIDEFMNILEKSVEIRMMSEVPLGAFLSGGVDSSVIVALMSKSSKSSVNTFCVGFGGDIGGYLDERNYAKLVSKRFETSHIEYEVLPKPDGLIETIINAFDEPFSDDSTIPSYFVCKAAKKNVTVALSGLGGDEVFAGYERYLGYKLSRYYEKLPFFIKEKVIRHFIDTIPERTDGHYTVNHMKRFTRSASLPRDLRYLKIISSLNENLRNNLFTKSRIPYQSWENCQNMLLSFFNSQNADNNNSKHSLDILNRAFYLDIKTYLPDDILTLTDRLSMHHSLEVRVPFIDHNLIEYSATIPPEIKLKWFRKKYLLKKAAKALIPKAVIKHRKQGFASPMARWLQKDLKPFVLETLSETNIKKHELFNPRFVDLILNEHFNRKEMHDKLIWSLVIFQKWYDLYMDQ